MYQKYLWTYAGPMKLTQRQWMSLPGSLETSRLDGNKDVQNKNKTRLGEKYVTKVYRLLVFWITDLHIYTMATGLRLQNVFIIFICFSLYLSGWITFQRNNDTQKFFFFSCQVCYERNKIKRDGNNIMLWKELLRMVFGDLIICWADIIRSHFW